MAKNSRLIELILVLSVGALLLSACSGEQSRDSSNTAITQAETTLSAEKTYPYPEKNYDGRELAILAIRTGYWGQDIEDLSVEGLNGTALNDAVYNRGQAVEARYNVKIRVEESGDVSSAIKTLVQSDDNAYNLIQNRGIDTLGTLAASGFLHDLNTVPNLNLSAPWYDQNIIKHTTILNKLMIIGGDSTVCDKSGVCCMLFNKKLWENEGFENLYTVIGDGRWTLDLMYSCAAAGTRDTDGDSSLTKNDQWGLLCENLTGWSFVQGCGLNMVEKDGDDLPYFNLISDEYVSVLDKVIKIMYDHAARCGNNYLADDYTAMFSADKVLLMSTAMSSIPPYREMKTDFGIIPYPKYDEAQTEYYSSLSFFPSRFLSVPITNGASDLDFIGIMIDSLSREGTDTVRAAYYDTLLQGIIARDNESAEMLDMIFDNIMYDLGAAYNWSDIWFGYGNFFASENTGIVSWYESVKSKALTSLENTIKEYTKTD